MSTRALAAIPFLGSGLGFRSEIESGILANRNEIDFVEVSTDKLLSEQRSLDDLARMRALFSIVPHGVGLSVGSVAPPDEDYLRAIKRVSDVTRSPYYSEHLAVTRVPGFDLGHLSPLWLTEESLAIVIRNVRRAQDYLGKPLVLENITHPFQIPNGSMSEPEFFSRLVDATGCGMLLDVTNLYINSVNHAFDPQAFLDALPLDHVVQVHLAGGQWSGGVLLDTHSESVHEESWGLLQAVCAATNVRAVVLEHDDNFPEIDVLLRQVHRAKRILNAGRSAPPAEGTIRNAGNACGERDVTALLRLDGEISESSVVVARGDKVETDRGDGVVLVSRTTGLRYGLDDVGARVWSLLHAPRTLPEIGDVLLAEYDVDASRCKRDLLALLRELAGMGFIEMSDGVATRRVAR